MGFDIASGGGGVKKCKGAGPIPGHAFAFQLHAAEPHLGFDDAAGRGRRYPGSGIFTAQRGGQRSLSHHGQGRDPPAFPRAEQRRHGAPHLRTRL